VATIIYFAFIAEYNRKVVFGLLFFVTAFLPPLLHLRYTQDFITADRYGYFPLIGIFISIAAFYDISLKFRKKLFSLLLVIWFSAIFINNLYAVNSWSSDINFWSLEVKTKPDSIPDNYFLALAYQQKGDFGKALPIYQKCINSDSSYNQKALISTGSIFFEMKEYRKSLEYYKLASNYNSEYLPLIYTNMAEVYLKQRNLKKAEQSLLQALKLDNTLVDAHLRISQIYRYMKKDKLADKHLKQAEKLR
jgi:tetratricopeptide (TPR) repeat protein